MKKIIGILLLILPILAWAQEVETTQPDSVAIAITSSDVLPNDAGVRDTLVVVGNQHEIIVGDTITPQPQATWDDGWRPDPLRAVWMGALVPGLGQIYNRSYWKLPIVYGAFMGCIYAVMWNGNMYEDYRQAYRDILTDEVLSTDPNRSYNAILPKGYTIESMGGRATYTNILKNKQNTYRRNRDLSIVGIAAVYALSIIDAFVDAELFDFDISPDLSLNVAPEIYYDVQRQRSSAGIHLALTIK